MKTKNLFAIFMASAFLIASNSSLADLTTELIAYYPFNGNANDESGNGYNGTVNGAVLTADRFGNPNSAYIFDLNKSIDVGQFNITVPCSVSLWIKSSGGNDKWNTIFGWNFTSDPYNGIQIATSGDGGIRIRMGDYSDDLISIVKTIDGDNKWHNIAITKSLNNEVVLYIDGIKNIYTISNSSLGINHNLYFGQSFRDSSPNNGWDEYFRGLIDDIRIYNRVLSATEIQQLYQEGANNESQAILSASVGRMMSQKGSITCTNLTTGNAKILKVVKGTTLWDCEEAGLVVNKGDKVQIKATVNGIAK